MERYAREMNMFWLPGKREESRVDEKLYSRLRKYTETITYVCEVEKNELEQLETYRKMTNDHIWTRGPIDHWQYVFLE